MEQLDKEMQQNTAGEPPSISDAIARLMAQPELLSMVASAIGAPVPSAAKPTEAAADKTADDSAPTPSPAPTATPDTHASVGASLPDLITTLAPLLGGKAGSLAAGGKDDDRTCLLRALKPYVSPGRREAIDYMIRLSRISEAIKHLT